MEDLAVSKRLDHHGIVAGVIKDLGLIPLIDEALGSSGCEEISEGEAVAAMIINGLGFTDRPLSLTPQFFNQVPVEELFREGVDSNHFNRHKLSRALDKIHRYGSSRLFLLLANSAAQQEGIAKNEPVSLDTSSFSVTGAKYEDTDENEVKISHGFSKDHRPDLPQIIQELIVSHDASVPLAMCCHSGNASDNTVFTERCEELKSKLEFKDGNKILVADSKLYCEKNSANLRDISFVTRIPETITVAKDLIQKSCSEPDKWEPFGEEHQCKRYSLEHYGIDQRWIVSYSQQGLLRASKRVEKNFAKEKAKIDSDLLHLQSTDFFCASDAQKALNLILKKWKYHSCSTSDIQELARYTRRGRPKSGSNPDSLVYKIRVTYSEMLPAEKDLMILRKACFILGTNCLDLTSSEVIKTYKSQGGVERGFRFLKDPLFFTSSFFLKKPERIEGLITVMTLALLVYSIAQRRLRKALRKEDQTIPNQIGKPIRNPTMKWVFQIFFGINIISLRVDEKIKKIIQGIDYIHLRVLKYTSQQAFKIYTACNATT